MPRRPLYPALTRPTHPPRTRLKIGQRRTIAVWHVQSLDVMKGGRIGRGEERTT